MSQLANKIKPKIQKVIDKFSTEGTVFREKFDNRKQPTGRYEKICELVGFYHQESIRSVALKLKYLDKGQVIPKKNEYYMVVVDENSLKIKVGDYLKIKGVRYNVVELGNANNFDIYFDILLERWACSGF